MTDERPYRHFYYVVGLGKIHARDEEEARTLAFDRLYDLPDKLTYTNWDELLKLQTVGPCMPPGRGGLGCKEHDAYDE